MRVKDQEEQLTSLPTYWFPAQTWSMRVGAGGMNNTTRFVDVEGTSYVLRLYETHRDMDKIMFEHSVLLALDERKRKTSISYTSASGAPSWGDCCSIRR